MYTAKLSQGQYSGVMPDDGGWPRSASPFRPVVRGRPRGEEPMPGSPGRRRCAVSAGQWQWDPIKSEWDVQHPDGSHTNVGEDGEITHGPDNFPGAPRPSRFNWGHFGIKVLMVVVVVAAIAAAPETGGGSLVVVVAG